MLTKHWFQSPGSSPPQNVSAERMISTLHVHFVKVQSGCDVVKILQDFTVKHNLGAAFLVHCVGEIHRAKIRLAEATVGFEPPCGVICTIYNMSGSVVSDIQGKAEGKSLSDTTLTQVREVIGPAQILSLVGTLSGGGHLHISLANQQEVVGGHLLGSLISSGTVEAVVGDCIDLLFVRLPDTQTGYNELTVSEGTSFVRPIPDHVQGNTSERQLQSSHQEGQQQSSMAATSGSAVRAFALRLGPGEDIMESLKALVARENLKAAFIMTCVGSVTKAKIRLAYNARKDPSASQTNKVVELEGHYEIVSFVGTLADVAHLHISLSDKDGGVIGGHVSGSLIVFTTAELVIGECTDYHMTREMDSRTGFPELTIKKF